MCGPRPGSVPSVRDGGAAGSPFAAPAFGEAPGSSAEGGTTEGSDMAAAGGETGSATGLPGFGIVVLPKRTSMIGDSEANSSANIASRTGSSG